MPRRLAVLLLTLVLAGCGGDGLPEPPEEYATFSAEGVEFRHPPGWISERPAAQPGVRYSAFLRPRGANPDKPGPAIDVRITELEGSLAEAPDGLPDGAQREPLELEVPGAQETLARRATGRLETIVVLARFGDTSVARLTVSEPPGGRAVDPEAVAGSFKVR